MAVDNGYNDQAFTEELIAIRLATVFSVSNVHRGVTVRRSGDQ